MLEAPREVLMKVTDVRAVIAIGLRGQFGLCGGLPWEGNRGREYVADVERFFELTRGHVVIMGHRTFSSVPDFAFKDRDILEIHASDRPEDVLARFPRSEERRVGKEGRSRWGRGDCKRRRW